MSREKQVRIFIIDFNKVATSATHTHSILDPARKGIADRVGSA